MKAALKVEVYTQWRKASSWKLLAADNSPIILGILQTCLFDEERILPSSIFHERVTRDLQALRNQGWDLPQTAQSYIAEWLAAGYLERNFPREAAEECYELSAASVQVIRFIDSLGKKHMAATESRLSLVIQQLSQLAGQTDDNPQMRIAQLEKERAKIDAEIADIHDGKISVLPHESALEHAREIVALAQEITSDFRYVRDNFQNLNRELRVQIVEGEASRGEVLSKLFSGFDMITDSEAGRSFSAFWRLLTDPEQYMLLEEATEQVLSRPFAKHLLRQERNFLLRLTKLLLDQGSTVHEVMQSFATGLKQFVQSRSYLEQRRLTQLLRDAQRYALGLKNSIRLIDIIIPEFYLTSSQVKSIAQLALYDPSLQCATGMMTPAETMSISLEAVSEWVAQSEINFRLIKKNIYTLLEKHKQISIAGILGEFPAEQGLGSIIGYIALGTRHGIIAHHPEVVNWQGSDGVMRSASIPRIYFLEGNRHEFSGP